MLIVLHPTCWVDTVAALSNKRLEPERRVNQGMNDFIFAPRGSGAVR